MLPSDIMNTRLERYRSIFIGTAFLVLLLSAAPVHAQESGRIEGTVHDAVTGAPLIATNVFLRGSMRGAFTDREGRFIISNLPPLEDQLVASHFGYREYEAAISIDEGETIHVEIVLMPETLEMERVTVTAHRRSESEFRTQKAVSVEDEVAIDNRSASSTADALREMPGILIQKTTAGHGAPIIRGLIGNDILLLYNGVRLNRPTIRPGGNQYLNTVDAEALQRIEVVRGPGSVLYGSDAIGGMVNMITHPPAFTGGEFVLRPKFSTRYTSADNGRTVHLGLQAAGARFSAQAGVTARSIGNLDPGGEIPVHDPTGYDDLGIHVITAFRLSEQQTIRADLLHVRQSEVPRYDQYASGNFETYLYEPQDRFLGMVEYTHRNPLPWLSTLEWNLSYQREHEGRLQRTTGSSTLVTDDDILNTIGTFLQCTALTSPRHTLRWGLEYYHDTVQSARTESTPDTSFATRGAFPDGASYSQFGVFFSDNFTPGPATDITVGIRMSRIGLDARIEDPTGHIVPHEDSFQNLTGNIGISHRLKPWLNLVGTISRGFRAPNFNDTVVLKVSNSGVDVPSPGLTPENSTNFELGAKIEWNGSDIETWVYRTSIRDLIVRTAGLYRGESWIDMNGNGLEDEGEQFQKKINSARAYIQGAEFQGRWALRPEWTLRTNLFVTYGENITAAEPMRRIPPLMGLLGIIWQREEMSAEIFLRAAADQRRLSADDIADTRIDPGGTPGWSDWNLRGSRGFGPVRLSVTLGNIFDHAYREHGSGVYNPGRHVVVSINWNPTGSPR